MNDVAKKHHGFDARLESIGRDFGDQDMAAWLPFSGISSDPHHHQIFVTVGGISSHDPIHLTHTIDSPRTVAVRSTRRRGQRASHDVRGSDRDARESPASATTDSIGSQERKDTVMAAQRFLVPIDFSEDANQALEYAIGLASKLEAR